MIVVANNKQAAELLTRLRTHPGPFGLDTECVVDIDKSPVLQGKIVCWSLAWVEPLCGRHPERGTPLAQRAFLWAEALDVFKSWLEDHTVPKVGHNIFTFDRHMFLNHGINLQGVVGDTLRMSRFLNADSSSEHGLKSLMQRVFGYQPVGEYKKLFGRTKASDVEDQGECKVTRRKVQGLFIPTLVGGPHQRLYATTELIPLDRLSTDYPWLLPDLFDYASLDAKVTLELYLFFKQLMEKRPAKRMGGGTSGSLWDLYSGWWNPGLLQLTEYERAGVCVDLERCARSSAALQPDIDQLAAQIEAWSPGVNWRSGPQGPRFLYDVKRFRVPPVCGSKLEATKRTQRGKRPGDFVALTWLADQPSTGAEDKAGLRAVLSWRALVKAKQYTDTFKEYVAADGLVHTILAPEADTGRLSSKAPALQQIPKRDKYKVRTAFVAPPGYKLIVADYSQLEMYVLGHFCKTLFGCNKVEQLLASGDMHGSMAKLCWPTKLAGIDSAKLKEHPDEEVRFLREAAKAVGYGLNYGKSAVGLGVGIRKDGEPIGTAEAQKILDAYFNAVPSLVKVQEHFKSYAREHWGVHTLLGRFRPIPEVHSDDDWVRGEGERAALNTPIQGSAHDVVATAMLRSNTSELPDLCRPGFYRGDLAALGATGVLQVHDELQWRVPANNAEAAAELVRAIMENPFKPGVFSLPLKADVHVADSWGAAK